MVLICMKKHRIVILGAVQEINGVCRDYREKQNIKKIFRKVSEILPPTLNKNLDYFNNFIPLSL